MMIVDAWKSYGHGPALNMLAAMALASNAYVLSDRGTWLAFQNRGDLATLLRAEASL